MDMQGQAKGFIAEFKAFLAKANAVSVAIGIAVGVATVTFVNAIVTMVINPIVDIVKISDRGFWIWHFNIGGLITAFLSFVATMLVIFILGKAIVREKPADAPKA